MNFFIIDNLSICKICSIHNIAYKKSVVNSKLKIMIEKKRSNEMGEDMWWDTIDKNSKFSENVIWFGMWRSMSLDECFFFKECWHNATYLLACINAFQRS